MKEMAWNNALHAMIAPEINEILRIASEHSLGLVSSISTPGFAFLGLGLIYLDGQSL